MLRPDAITLKQLRALSAVAQHGSITRAAEAIRLTPPAVHTQLKQLAANMGAEMLRRGPSGKMEITDEGALVLETIRRVEVELDACMRSVAELRDGRAGLVQLGVVSTGKYFAPRLVATLKQVFPEIKVELVVGNREQTVAALESRQVQLAIMGRPPRFPINHSEPVGPHPHVLIAPPDHWLAKRDRIDPEDLIDETFIAREEGSGTRILMTRFLDRIGEGRIYDMTTMSSNETIKQAVMAGLGIALISQHTVVEELHGGRLVTLDMPGLPIERAWYLLARADVPLSPAARRIRTHISGMKGSFLPQL
ncbi:LysR family regulator CbbR [Sinisalibacter aestuarii]|uniref:HTH-type transcriptional regulator CbbR n=1 Tax=Sinisalibacter aestuarii TaxID=2949426 RepID=A0ABQ5LMJ1_9RHOB|nr:LysR family transcriptional regulator [Sinisalibacter aestuarii]GKY86237.1 LysR family transcriptional regulator [Sinisalibacter aestuarii]